MAMNPRIWYPIAVVGSVANVIGVAFAVSPGEPWHATLHAGLAVAFGLWAQHLKGRLRPAVTDGDTLGEIEGLREEVLVLRREVSELQERMDFAERVLSQAREMQHLDRPEGQ